jgi:hypothetical protein
MTTYSTTHPGLGDGALPAPNPPAAAVAVTPDDVGDGTPEADAVGVPSPEFDRLEDWVGEYFLPMFRRTLGGEFRWCAQWWRHGEAISRLNALWHAWEVLRIQPGAGIGTWYRDHLDRQLPILLGARGPFYQCSEETHREPHEAAAQPAPDGWWDDAEPGSGEAPDEVAPSGTDDGDSHDAHDVVSGDGRG